MLTVEALKIVSGNDILSAVLVTLSLIELVPVPAMIFDIAAVWLLVPDTSQWRQAECWSACVVHNVSAIDTVEVKTWPCK